MLNMPDFLVIGVAKSGTTSLYAYLNQHPQIAMSAVKEPNFFEFGELDQSPSLTVSPRPSAVQTLSQYQALFANLPAESVCGEASPSNFQARACERIHRYLPDAKFVCLLRQPIDRAYSAYAMHFRSGIELEPDFYRAYQRSSQRWENHLEPRSNARFHAAWYVSRLQDWFSRFPRQQFHIGLYDDLKADPLGVMRSIYRFLEVDSSFTPNTTQIHNPGIGVRSTWLPRLIGQNIPFKRWARKIVPPPLRQKVVRGLLYLNQAPLPPLDPQLRRELTRPQHDDILRLQDLIGRDLTHWLAE